MAPALSESSSDDGAPPDLVSSSSDGGDRWPASGLTPPFTNIPVAIDESDEEEPADLPPGTGTAVDACGATSPTSGTARRPRAQLSALEAAARNLGQQHAAAQVAAARSATEERRPNRSQRQEGVASDPRRAAAVRAAAGEYSLSQAFQLISQRAPTNQEYKRS